MLKGVHLHPFFLIWMVMAAGSRIRDIHGWNQGFGVVWRKIAKKTVIEVTNGFT